MRMLSSRLRNLLALCLLAGLTGCCCGPCGSTCSPLSHNVFTPTPYTGCVDCGLASPSGPPLACGTGCGSCYGPPAPPCLHLPCFSACSLWHKTCQMTSCVYGTVKGGLTSLFCHSCGHGSCGCGSLACDSVGYGCDSYISGDAYGAADYGVDYGANGHSCPNCQSTQQFNQGTPAPVGSYYPPVEIDPYQAPAPLSVPPASPGPNSSSDVPLYPHSPSAPSVNDDYFTPHVPTRVEENTTYMIHPPIRQSATQPARIQQTTWVPTQF